MPFDIRLESSVFKNRRQNQRFIDAMHATKHATVGVYRACPYVDISLADHMDESAFVIRVMSPDRITVMPHLGATQASVSRLVDHIFEKFQEGKVLKHEYVEWE